MPPQRTALLRRQPTHDTLPDQQRHRIRRERPQETRHEPAPVPPPPGLAIHGPRGVPPAPEPPLPVAQAAAERIRHDALLDEVARVARQPEDLGAQAAGPEVDGGRAERGALPHRPRDDVVAAPPEEEEAAEDERGRQAVEEPPHAVVPVDLGHAVQGPRVEPVGLARGVLHLQARLDVLDGRGDEADGRAREAARHAVADGRQGRLLDVEDVVGHDAAVDVERAHHDGVHAHPADEGRRRALVQAADALAADRLHDAVEGPLEARRVRRLHAHLDRVKGVADWWMGVSNGFRLPLSSAQSCEGVCLPVSFATPLKTPATKPL